MNSRLEDKLNKDITLGKEPKFLREYSLMTRRMYPTEKEMEMYYDKLERYIYYCGKEQIAYYMACKDIIEYFEEGLETAN
jgi:DNA-binding ferritin-like protein (Dps family)